MPTLAVLVPSTGDAAELVVNDALAPRRAISMRFLVRSATTELGRSSPDGLAPMVRQARTSDA